MQEQESARKAEAEQRRVDDAEAMRVREELGVMTAKAAQLETELVAAQEARAAEQAEQAERQAAVERERAVREKEARAAFLQTSSPFDTPFLSRLMCGLRESKVVAADAS